MANATAIHGTIIDHGKAPYKNNPENNAKLLCEIKSKWF